MSSAASNTTDNEEEFLSADPEIPGQRFTLLSFLSPERVLADKKQFFFEMFLKNYEVQWKTKNLEKFLAEQVLSFNAKLEKEAGRLSASDISGASEICLQSRMQVDGVLEAYKTFVTANQAEINQTKIKESFDDYIFANGKEIEDKFYAKNNFQTTVRGLKIRGTYSTQEEATVRAKKLQKNDPIHNIFVAEVGKWLPWDPSPNDIENQEYAEDQLNTLMKGYKENEEARDNFYSKNPEAKKNAFKKGVQSMVEPDIDGKAGTADEMKASVKLMNPENEAVFNGPADLAIQRKMERAAAAEAAEADAKAKSS